ncbi:hypothetical protein QKG26_gp009 [Chelonid alphaherpesvirus 5]|nr:hypothetical protein QKG26_gp009 [Chelonid alphaherpesvirus 5]AHA93297.1 hypothetical protein [Chelonid alphaherpesvirus 5]
MFEKSTAKRVSFSRPAPPVPTRRSPLPPLPPPPARFLPPPLLPPPLPSPPLGLSPGRRPAAFLPPPLLPPPRPLSRVARPVLPTNAIQRPPPSPLSSPPRGCSGNLFVRPSIFRPPPSLLFPPPPASGCASPWKKGARGAEEKKTSLPGPETFRRRFSPPHRSPFLSSFRGAASSPAPDL